MVTATAMRMTSVPPGLLLRGTEQLTVSSLGEEHRAEVMEFLSARPIHTVMMVGLIRDNGLVSEHNRGTFYGCRTEDGELEGVGLIGHATLLETRTDRALAALARQAQAYTRTHMIMGEQERISKFWSHYAEDGQEMRLACRELLFELKPPVAVREEVFELRRATARDLELIMPAQAQMAFEESGVNPLEVDPEGFRRRCLRRIEQGRTWVLIEDGRLLFKTEIVSDTPDVNYLEGIYVDPDERGKGYGLQCLSQLTRMLLRHTRSVCILVNERNTAAHAFYRKAGFKFRCVYDTIFLAQK
ncbi:MAG TPA: GNAT family N-acetyltransferase [Pyrinomonadaceae bacterium]|nr:GNAT family N-acetyltransferase [Pyrinomonadaceae bacterium]